MRVGGIPYWPYNQALRFSLPVVPASEASSHTIATGEEELTRIRQVGWVELPDPVGGRLAVWWLEQYGGGLFVPFRDATAGTSSYGAGRYLLDTAKGADLGARRQPPGARLQLRLPPIVSLRRTLAMPARAAREHRECGNRGGREAVALKEIDLGRPGRLEVDDREAEPLGQPACHE